MLACALGAPPCAALRTQRARTHRLSLPRCAAREREEDETPTASTSSSASSAAAWEPTTTTTQRQRRRRTKEPSPPPPSSSTPPASSSSASPPAANAKGADATAILWLEFEEAALGCVKEVSLVVRRPCRACLGAGTEGGAAPVPCERCRGRGRVRTSRTAGFRRIGGRGNGGGGDREEEEEEERRRRGGRGEGDFASSSPSHSPSSSSSACSCPLCQGSGISPLTLRCTECAGTGSVEVAEEALVRVPAGATDATALRIRNAGHSAAAKGPVRLEGGAVMLRPEEEEEGVEEEEDETSLEEEGEGGKKKLVSSRGDAYILCCVAAAAVQREWARRGLDVVAPLSLSPFDAVLGVPALPVRTLRGLRRVEVPSGTQHGDELVLKGEGAGGGEQEEEVDEEGGGRRERRGASSSSAAAAAAASPGDHVLVVRLRVPEEVNSSDRGLLLRLREIAQRV